MVIKQNTLPAGVVYTETVDTTYGIVASIELCYNTWSLLYHHALA